MNRLNYLIVGFSINWFLNFILSHFTSFCILELNLKTFWYWIGQNVISVLKLWPGVYVMGLNIKWFNPWIHSEKCVQLIDSGEPLLFFDRYSSLLEPGLNLSTLLSEFLSRQTTAQGSKSRSLSCTDSQVCLLFYFSESCPTFWRFLISPKSDEEFDLQQLRVNTRLIVSVHSLAGIGAGPCNVRVLQMAHFYICSMEKRLWCIDVRTTLFSLLRLTLPKCSVISKRPHGIIQHWIFSHQRGIGSMVWKNSYLLK